MNLKLNLSFSQIGAFFKRSNTVIFWLALVIVIILESLVLKHSVSVMLGLRNAPPQPLPNRSVRINFTDYNEIIKRINAAASGQVQDTTPVENNPFLKPTNTAPPTPPTQPAQ